jgi:drug/metabolite transporter (DMT)-like permease
MLGALAALISAAIWAYGSTQYAHHSRALGSARVNLARASTVLPVFFVATALFTHGRIFAAVDVTHTLWLGLSVICAYAFADNIFFAAARLVGVTTAMAIASTYPLWATLAGAVWRHEPLGMLHAGGALLCVGGVVALILLAPRAAHEMPHDGDRPESAKDSRTGILFAILTSLLWAGNSVATKLGGTGLITVQANLIRFLCAWPILAVTCASVPRPTRDRKVARRAYVALIPVSLLEAGIGSSLFVYGLAHSDLAVGATLSSLAPLMSVPFALIYGEERWSLSRFAAVLITVAGVILLVRAA